VKIRMLVPHQDIDGHQVFPGDVIDVDDEVAAALIAAGNAEEVRDDS
jgi:hypothetical protein